MVEPSDGEGATGNAAAPSFHGFVRRIWRDPDSLFHSCAKVPAMRRARIGPRAEREQEWSDETMRATGFDAFCARR
jgi:hypothetical protein